VNQGRGARHDRVRRLREATGRHRTALVVIGCSLGGLQALQVILRTLPGSYPIPIAVAQHRHPSSEILSLHLQQSSELAVCDAEDQEPFKPGHVYLAPANYHLIVDGRAFRLSVDEAVQYARPSVDVLFESAADALQQLVAAVILTGANADGAVGVARIKQGGGLVLVQDPAESVAPEMPSAAIAMTEVDHVLPLEQIARFLIDRLEYSEQSG
jgi:two-component system chemotaxis response regulator CheB